MARIGARLFYQSGRMFRQEWLHGHEVKIGVHREDRHSGPRFVINTWGSDLYRPRKKGRHLAIEISEETMDTLIREYNQLFQK